MCRLLFLWLVWMPPGFAGAATPSGEIRIDAEEWRDQPVRHLYIHGTWNRTSTFRICMPAPAAWKRRMLQYLEGSMGGRETAGDAGYALSRGAVYVESSQGHIGLELRRDHRPEELSYGASYATVQYAKTRSVELYGAEPAYTYVTGGSGGGTRTTGLLERFPKVYDGAVSMIGGGTMTFNWYVNSVMAAYGPELRELAADLDDAVRPGGSGDIFALVRTPKQRRALEMIVKTGFPLHTIWRCGVQPRGAVSMMDVVKYELDPEYFSDFWNGPGYAGADGKCRAELEEVGGTVESVDTAARKVTSALKRANNVFDGYTIVFTSGKAKGVRGTLLRNTGAELAVSPLGPSIADVQPGDRFTLNNRDLVAWEWWHRYLTDVTKPLMPEFFPGGEPHYPQRPVAKMRYVVEPERPLGQIHGKLITIFGTDDPFNWPSSSIRYHRQAREALGAATDDHFRIYFVEHGVHGNPFVDAPYRSVSNGAASRKALEDVMAWVEAGVAPPPSTQYSLDKLNQLVLPVAAVERKGCQPVVRLSADDREGRVQVAAGKDLEFRAQAEDPDNDLARLEMDFEGRGKYAESKSVTGRAASAAFHHRYDRPGVYFATVRVTDSTAGPGGSGIQNLASIRVIVK